MQKCLPVPKHGKHFVNEACLAAYVRRWAATSCVCRQPLLDETRRLEDDTRSKPMDEVRALFVSLPHDAQAHLRAEASRKKPINLLRLTRAVYPYVQTLAEAKEIAGFLAREASSDQEPSERRDAQRAASVGTGVFTRVF